MSVHHPPEGTEESVIPTPLQGRFDPEMRGGGRGVGDDGGIGLELLQCRTQTCRFTSEFHGGGIGEALTLPGERGLEQQPGRDGQQIDGQ